MAKRNRGSNRPGQRRPDRHGSARPQSQPTPRAGGSLSAAEEARAAEIESQTGTRLSIFGEPNLGVEDIEIACYNASGERVQVKK